jgi:phosphoribosyl-dephospho-CoA transferase
MTEIRYRPHDLLKLRRCPAAADAPAWTHDAFARAPFAVVRRAPAAPGTVAVGLRGTTRAERYGACTDESDVEASVPPEQLIRALPPPGRDSLAPFALLRALANNPCLSSYEWGPTGSTAFELATGIPTITPSSDLDLLIRTPVALSHDQAEALHVELQACAARAGVRIDVQLETPAGGVALAEWAMRKSLTMVKSADGPRLVADPWSAGPGHANGDD